MKWLDHPDVVHTRDAWTYYKTSKLNGVTFMMQMDDTPSKMPSPFGGEIHHPTFE